VANGDFVRTRPESFRDRLVGLGFRQPCEKFRLENRFDFFVTLFFTCAEQSRSLKEEK
jgi:hypothetical protein